MQKNTQARQSARTRYRRLLFYLEKNLKYYKHMRRSVLVKVLVFYLIFELILF